MLGINGQPTITFQGTVTSRYLFVENELDGTKIITLRIKNISFEGVGIVKLINNIVSDNISFLSCHFEKTVTGMDIIRIDSHPNILYTGSVYFHNCHFINNVAKHYSRAISIKRTRSIFHGCYFKDNLITIQGLILLDTGVSVIKYSFFHKNNAGAMYFGKQQGGVVNATTNSSVEILNCHFKGNEATDAGGAIVITLETKLFIKLSLFQYNAVGNKHTSDSDSRGGAVYADDSSIVEIRNSLFRGNKATYAGGAVYAVKTNLIIESSSFEKNKALSKHMIGVGGALYASLNSAVKILRSSFMRNEATYTGGAIVSLAKTLVITSSLFKHNTAVRGGAIFAHFNTSVKILNCSLKANLATPLAGAIFTNGHELIIRSTLFERNAALSKFSIKGHGFGGAVISTAAVSNIQNSVFFQNKASHAGGAIFTWAKILVITSSVFEYNTAVSCYCNESYGGAIAAHGNTRIEILNCSLKANLAKDYGGAIFTKGHKLIIRSTLFECNTALSKFSTKGHGGAVGAVVSIFNIQNCLFLQNKASCAGGAIHTKAKDLVITSSVFEYNTAVTFGGAIYAVVVTLIIRSTLFEGNTALSKIIGMGTGGAIAATTTLSVKILNCSLKSNLATYQGGAVHTVGNELIIRSTLLECNTAIIGGAIIASSKSIRAQVYVKGSQFKNNSAHLLGGAIAYRGSNLLVETSEFINNTAALNPTGTGGAINTSSSSSRIPAQTNISHCVFDGNRASFMGGAIRASRTRLHIRYSSFRSAPYPHSGSFAGGDLLYSESPCELQYVSIADVNGYNSQNSLILHQGISFADEGNLSYLTLMEVHMKCLTGKNIAVSKVSTWSFRNKFFVLSVSCLFCPSNSYSLYASQLDVISPNEFVEKNTNCYHCPLGGICEKGKVRAAKNFWGYLSGKQVHFITCPFGYCCFNKECVNYSSCHTGRTGTLCGQCQKGLNETFFTSDCLPPEKCYHYWYSLVVMIIGVVYVLVFMYLNEITKAMTALLLPRFDLERFKYIIKSPTKIIEFCKRALKLAKLKFLNEVNQGCQMQYFTDDIIVEEANNEEQGERMRGNVQLVDDEELQSIVALHKDDSVDNVVPGLLKVMIFFYQTNVLFKIYSGSKSKGFLNSLQEILSTLFNLRSDGTFTRVLFWCPFDKLRPVTKILLKTSFIIYLFFVILLVLILARVGGLLKITGIRLTLLRLLRCTLRLSFISYAGITAACFSLLLCVQLGPYGKVLFADGSVPCYKGWQIFIICLVCFWIFPFPVTIYASSQLLHSNMLSAKKFPLSLLFPLPTIFYWLYNCHKNARKLTENEPVLNEDVQEILRITEGPFRKINHCHRRSGRRLSWDAILIGRRLVLIFFKTFVLNAFLRLMIMLICTHLFLLHHIYTKPFSSNFVNNVETVSLSMLHIICVLNLIPAYSYSYPTFSYDHNKDAIQTLNLIETALNLVFPVLVGSVLAILAFIRIVQFVIWLCCLFLRLIRFCCKNKIA